MATWLIRLILVLALLIAAAGSARAGGWASVRLDSAPGHIVAGKAWQFGFVVKQHDRTPTNDVHPVVTAVHAATGETMMAEGVQEGPVGHFVTELTFPAAGDWKWSIKPEPFDPTTLETLTVFAPDAVDQRNPDDPAVALVAPVAGGGWRISLTIDVAPLPATANQLEPVEITITDTGFSPASVEIPAGTDVIWTSQSALPHGVMSDNLAFRDSSLLDRGDDFRQTFSQPGTYRYWCGPHPFMTGVIVVSGPEGTGQ